MPNLTQPVELRYLPLDLASLKSVRSFKESFDEVCQQLDTLILNAGVMALPERKQTEDGYEYQFGVNHLGHFLLTNLLMDKLAASGSGADPSRAAGQTLRAPLPARED
ncbi:Short-chain dehydrogenase TIC 32 A [Durusdinium trenchii]|uniref:Chloroplastic (Pod-specific dehydrogenase SAC25) (Translocon at the inner envelope membrane of chloroplasts 32 A) (BnTIC32A) n=1 Tax=Durusdinium trenchii TaxID=1381693 RepID=A0ABP0MAU3_9DINO